MNNPLSDANNESQGQQIHHFINASYRIANDKWGITPNTSFLLSPQQPFNALAGLLVDYKQKILISAAYRNEGTIVLGAGILFFDIVRASYSYDLPMSGQHIYEQGSHEVILKFMLNKKEKSDEN